MAAADVSALLDVASSPTPTPEATPTEAIVDDAAPVESPTEESTEAGEGAPPAPPTGDEAAPAPDDKVDARTNPDAIRKALKALRDSSPENAPIARRLNDIVGREGAYRQVFPKVADA